MNIISTLTEYFSFPFVRNALIACVLVSLCAALLGVTLVLKRYSMIGDGLSHVAFGATAIAAVLKLAPMAVTIPVTIAAAVILLAVNTNKKIKGDSAIAIISVAAMAFGYILMNVFSASANISGDVCSSLFGSTSILTLGTKDVALCVALAITVLIVFVVFYNKLFAVTFDESFASATGINARFYNVIIAIVTAIVIVLAMNLVGALLISALIIFPALTSMRIFKSFRAVIISSAVIAICTSLTGLIASILLSTPVGATIVITDITVFAVFAVIGKIAKR